MRNGRTRRIASVGAVVALTSAGAVLAFGASAGAKSTEVSFEDDGHHEWVVPAGVCSVSIDALGASGGSASNTDDPGVATFGGSGGQAEADIVVTPGETLHVYVGGEGEDAIDDVRGEGGFNGGGDGGAASPNPTSNAETAGGGGGGASDVRQGGTELDDRVLVAGGGGGAGGGSADGLGVDGAGGDGGGEEGEDGLPGRDAIPAPDPAQAGEGGGESEGGDGGISNPPEFHGDDGELGEGGDGGGSSVGPLDIDGGGGGGGGWYGGGGGGAGVDPNDGLTPIFEDGGGGGGGSGYGPDDTEFHTGEHDGDGEVTISYDPVADACAAEAIVIEPRFTG